jgi:phage terminase large subunit
MRQNGYEKIRACKKGPGSVEQGVTFIRSFEEIVIDPSCTHTIEEAKLYKYKVDKLTGDVLPDIVDKFNHSWDAVRYAIEPLMPHKRPGTVSIN